MLNLSLHADGSYDGRLVGRRGQLGAQPTSFPTTESSSPVRVCSPQVTAGLVRLKLMMKVLEGFVVTWGMKHTILSPSFQVLPVPTTGLLPPTQPVPLAGTSVFLGSTGCLQLLFRQNYRETPLNSLLNINLSWSSSAAMSCSSHLALDTYNFGDQSPKPCPRLA